jgi:hypothetical protein
VIPQGAQQSLLTLHLAAFVRPRENQNADTLDLAERGERMLADLRKLQRSDPTFGGRAVTHIAESRILPGSQNDGSFDDVGVFVVQPILLVVFWADPSWINTAIEAVVRACKGIKKSAGYNHTVKYVSRRGTDPEEMPSEQLPAVWVLRPLGPSEDVTFIDE